MALQKALPVDQGFKALKEKLLRAGEKAPRAAQRSVAECIAAMCCVSESSRIEPTLRECINVLQGREERVVRFNLLCDTGCACLCASFYCMVAKSGLRRGSFEACRMHPGNVLRSRVDPVASDAAGVHQRAANPRGASGAL